MRENKTLELLVAAMNRDALSLAEEMKLDSDAIIVSQGEEYAYEELSFKGHTIRYFSMKERGVGLSRNHSLLRAGADIAVFADQDIVYDEGYAEKILASFDKHSEADVLLFNVQAAPGRETYHIEDYGRVRWYNYGRYPTYSFAVRTKKIHDANITFSLLFGGGARHSNGEDSLFLHDCLKAGLKVYHVPVRIGWEQPGESTWFVGYNEKFFYDRGVLYRHLYGAFARLWALRFVLAKRKVMCVDIPWKKAYGIMVKGIRGLADEQ